MIDAEKTLRDLLDKLQNERGYEPSEIKIEEVSPSGTNYTSALFLISVSLPNKELKLFAKVANIGPELRSIMHGDWLYSTERFVYNELMHLYNDLQKDLKEEHKFIFPEFYGCNDEVGMETIIMENLVEKGYETYLRFKSMDWDHGRVGVESLAKFHALSFALEKSDPKKFNRMTANMSFRVGSEEHTQSSTDLLMGIVERSVNLLKEEHKDAVRQLVMQPNLLPKFNKPIGRPVISHGDYRLSNMLFKGQEASILYWMLRVQGLIYELANKGDNLKLRLVDYQTVHAGCLVADLIYFIFLGSDEQFRRLHYEELVSHYYKSLEESLRRLSIDPLEVYPREKFDTDLKKILPYAIILGVMVLPIVTVDTDAAPKVNTEEADISAFLMETNDLYAERFRGIINDCVRWGVL